MPGKLEEFDRARQWIARLQSELDRLRHQFGPDLGGEELPVTAFDMLILRAGRDRFGLPLSRVCEVGMVAETSSVPGSPPWVAGALDLRGEAVIVLDLAARLALSDLPEVEA